jgi:hypothetical protein
MDSLKKIHLKKIYLPITILTNSQVANIKDGIQNDNEIIEEGQKKIKK